VVYFELKGTDLDVDVIVPSLAVRLRDESGRVVGTVMVCKPAAGMATLASVITQSDPRPLRLMQQVSHAGRRPAAILFADLEGSTPLSRRLSTASYFSLGRHLVRAADRCVIDAGGSSVVMWGMAWWPSSWLSLSGRNRRRHEHASRQHGHCATQ
jgi:hypothetical protein